MNYKFEDESSEKSLSGLGGEYLYFGEENNLFFGASLARFTVCRVSADLFGGCGDWKEHWYKTKLSAGYDLENSLFTPYVSVLHSRLDLDFEIFEDYRIFEETSNDTSLGLGTYIGNPGFRGFAALQGIGADELSFAVGVYRTRWNNMVLGGSYETPADDPFNLLSTIYLRIGYSF